MQYRLIENHPAYGWFGKLVSRDELLAIHHADRSLFEPCQPTDPFHYRVCVETQTDEDVCYGLDNYRETADLSKQILKGFTDTRLSAVYKSISEQRTFEVRLDNKLKVKYKFTNV